MIKIHLPFNRYTLLILTKNKISKWKILFLTLSILILTNVLSAQEATYQLSSHILDITQGKPASNVKISLSKQDKKGNWNIIDEKYTDENGRIKNFLKEEKGTDHKGIYKLTFSQSLISKRWVRKAFILLSM